MHVSIKKPKIKSALMTGIFLGGAALSGCATTAVQYNTDSIGNITDSKLRPAAVPLTISGPLSIDQVRARTLAHNSEYGRAQTQLIETVRKAGRRGKDFLPQAYASTYGNWRNNTSASVGVKVDDNSGTLPKDFYTAQDQAVAISNFTTSWDLLEIGLSGFKANRRAINAYSKGEQNQYLCNKLIVDVENAYWRAVAFEQAETKSEWLKSRVTYALNLSGQRAEENPDIKLQELMFQRELIDINRWYQSLYRSLISAKPDLARLMNVPAGTEFALQSTRLPAELGEIGQQDTLALVSAAYKHRPEIRQSLYKTDLTRLKNKEDLWRHLPGLKVFLGGNNNSNSFVLNSNFASAGASLSWDLLRVGQIGETKRAGETALVEDQHQTERGAHARAVLYSRTNGAGRAAHSQSAFAAICWSCANLPSTNTPCTKYKHPASRRLDGLPSRRCVGDFACIKGALKCSSLIPSSSPSFCHWFFSASTPRFSPITPSPKRSWLSRVRKNPNGF